LSGARLDGYAAQIGKRMMKLWHVRAETPYLLATRCEDCGNRSFPATVRCVRCGSSSIQQVELSREGVIETRAVGADAGVGQIRLDDGTLVLGQLGADNPKIGARVVFAPTESVVRFVGK
jgi:uncharacterized OB-fold protein